jgi:integrase
VRRTQEDLRKRSHAAASRAVESQVDGEPHAECSDGKARHVFLTSEGVMFFQQICAGRAGDELLLRRAAGGPWGKSDQLRPMAAAVKRAKITPPISFHGLRHTYASLSVMGSVPLQVVARNLGHVDTRMVERHYGHLEDSFIRKAIREGAPRFGAVKKSKVTALRERA